MINRIVLIKDTEFSWHTSGRNCLHEVLIKYKE